MQETLAVPLETPPARSPSPRRRRALIALLAVFGLVLAGAYGLALHAYQTSTENAAPMYVGEWYEAEGSVLAQATVVSVDQGKGEMVLRLEFYPQGSVLDPSTGHPTVNMTLSAFGGGDSVQKEFRVGNPMTPTDLTVRLYGGHVSDYPFDRHQGSFGFYMTGYPDGDEAALAVPLSIAFVPTFPGWTIGAETSELYEDHGGAVQLTVERSALTKGVAAFIWVAMLVLALGSMAIAVATLFRSDPPESDLLGYMGALLFAFPALREASPGTPPLGALSDFIAFFWAEGLVAVALVIMVTVWLRRQRYQ
ncbi:MAG TPA: DUF4436 family protein [Candidatus Thermoplasmatota archaeon]|nr:DUF4436 family protein [Candidatus Thermoplasmatota archaeon]